MKKETIKLTLNIEKDLKIEFNTKCIKNGVNMTDIIIGAIKEYVNNG